MAIRVLVAVLVCIAVSFNVQRQKTPLLFGGLKSRQSFEQVKALPQFKNAKWEMTIYSDVEANAQRPPFKIVVAETNYRHLNFFGRLKLHFYNNRLWTTKFQPLPTQSSQYMKALSQTTGMKLSRTSSTRFGNMTYEGPNNTISSVDKRLTKEANDWISRYS